MRAELRQRLRRLERPAWLGTVRRTSPLSARWGADRGTPVDRHYIHQFLAQWSTDIRGRVLEVGTGQYARHFGTVVNRLDIIDIDPANARATLIADLSAADAVASSSFDCFILTQTLQFIYDVRAAVHHACRILRPGGVLLATLPAVSRIDPALAHTDFWRFTVPACRRVFGDAFGADQVQVMSYGNVLSSVAFLMGLASQELSTRELRVRDTQFPVIVAVRAVRS